MTRCSPEHEARIAHLLALEENWNSYRAPPINPQAIEHARPFINRLEELGLTPWITPENDGGVMVERAGKDDYSFSFGPEGVGEIYLEGLSLEAMRDILECAAKHLQTTAEIGDLRRPA